MIGDIEQIIVATLDASTSPIRALGANVSGMLPKTSFTRPWILVTQIDALNATASDVEHLISYLIQLDCYAGSDQFNGQSQASTLARTARDVLFGMKGQTIQGAVISNVIIKSHIHQPDRDFEPTRERYIVDAEVWAHG